MINTQPGNFEDVVTDIQQSKVILKEGEITVLEALLATLRKVATGAVNPKVFTSSGQEDSPYDVAFQDLKREVLRGHLEILEVKVTSLRKARKEFGLDY